MACHTNPYHVTVPPQASPLTIPLIKTHTGFVEQSRPSKHPRRTRCPSCEGSHALPITRTAPTNTHTAVTHADTHPCNTVSILAGSLSRGFLFIVLLPFHRCSSVRGGGGCSPSEQVAVIMHPYPIDPTLTYIAPAEGRGVGGSGVNEIACCSAPRDGVCRIRDCSVPKQAPVRHCPPRTQRSAHSSAGEWGPMPMAPHQEQGQGTGEEGRGEGHGCIGREEAGGGGGWPGLHPPLAPKAPEKLLGLILLRQRHGRKFCLKRGRGGGGGRGLLLVVSRSNTSLGRGTAAVQRTGRGSPKQSPEQGGGGGKTKPVKATVRVDTRGTLSSLQ